MYQRWIDVTQQSIVVGETVPYAYDKRGAHVASLYVLDQIRFGPRLLVEAGTGVRLEKYAESRASFDFSPRLALVAHSYEGGLTKLVLGRAFRAPNLYERFYTEAVDVQPRKFDLRPEVILSGELEHTHRVNEEVLATFGVFANRLSNVLRLDKVPNDPNEASVFANGDKPYEAVGAESEVR